MMAEVNNKPPPNRNMPNQLNKNGASTTSSDSPCKYAIIMMQKGIKINPYINGFLKISRSRLIKVKNLFILKLI
jgi:hypothetical protein